MHAFPTALPLGVGEEASKDGGIKITLAVEIGIEPAVRQTRTVACAVDDPYSLLPRDGQQDKALGLLVFGLPSVPRTGFAFPAKYDLEHI